MTVKVADADSVGEKRGFFALWRRQTGAVYTFKWRSALGFGWHSLSQKCAQRLSAFPACSPIVLQCGH
jgi:hypothetical protein